MTHISILGRQVHTPCNLDVFTPPGVGTVARIREDLDNAGSRYALVTATNLDAIDFHPEALGVGHNGPVRLDEVDTIIVDDAGSIGPDLRGYVEELVIFRGLRQQELESLQNVVLIYNLPASGGFTLQELQGHIDTFIPQSFIIAEFINLEPDHTN